MEERKLLHWFMTLMSISIVGIFTTQLYLIKADIEKSKDIEFIKANSADRYPRTIAEQDQKIQSGVDSRQSSDIQSLKAVDLEILSRLRTIEQGK